MLRLADFYKKGDPASAFVKLDAAGYVTTAPILETRFMLERIARDAWQIRGQGPNGNAGAERVPGGDAPDWRAVDAAMARLAQGKPMTLADAARAAQDAGLGEPQPDGSTAYRIAIDKWVLEAVEYPDQGAALRFIPGEATRRFDPERERLADLGTRFRLVAGRAFSPLAGIRITPVACIVSHDSGTSALALGHWIARGGEGKFLPGNPEEEE